jgi:plasmid stability protein
MAQILIRDLDDDLVAMLKARAKSNHRSLQGEIKALLEEKVRGRSVAVIREELRLFRAGLGKRKFSDSAKLIRADRER